MARSVKIALPHNGWKPRPRQMAAWRAIQAGCRRMVLVWHRRYGKDEIALHRTAVAMVQRAATYWHMLPLKDQARTAIWESINPHTGLRRIDEAFPDALFDKRETDMMIHCKINASTWQIKGSDNYGAGIGSPPAGIVFSEYSRANPDAWAYLRPILRENDGWAMFISTPYGHNHFENLYRYAISAEGIADGWFGELLTVEDTGSMTPAEIQRELRELAAERQSIEEATAIVNQEYYCSFDSAIPGAIYGPIITAMENMQPPRITAVPFNPAFAVEASTDLGASEGNDMAIWWHQRIGRETHIIDCDSAVGVGIDWVAEKLNQRARERGFVYAPISVNLPHDAGHPQPSNEGAASFAQKLSKNYQYRNRVNPVTRSLAWSITRVKQFLPTCVIDATHCATGINALRNYHRKWDEKKRCYSENPVHDWASNYCFTGDTAVLTRYGMRQIMDLPDTGEVLTPCGWRQYTHPRITRKAAPLVAVTFADGHTVRCTPDHLFATDSGWISAESLTSYSAIQSCLTKSRSISMAVYSALGQAIRISRAVASFCTALFGRVRSARSPMGATSITATAMRQTIALKTWSAWTPVSISGCQRNSIQGSVSMRATAPQNGTHRKRVENGTQGTPRARKAGQSGRGSRAHALSAARSFCASFAKVLTRRNTAHRLAKPLRITSVARLQETQDVWCLTVDGSAFALANGAVVHNCDAFRTMVEARESDGGVLVPADNPGVTFPSYQNPNRRYAVGADDDPLGRN